MTKVINDFKINLGSISAAGATRQFHVLGDDGAIFSLEVKNEDGYYYNFTTKTFTSTKARLKNKKISSGKYTNTITFPSVGDNDQYDIYLWASTAHDTVHTNYSEVRFGDGSLDINSSTGSNSSLLQKVIYQYTDVTVTLSAISPAGTHHSSGDFSGMSVSTATITAGRGQNVVKTAFSVGVTVAATKAVRIGRQPLASDLAAYTSVTIGSGVKIPGENIWAGTARNTDTVDGAVSSATKIVMDTNVADKMKVGDRITGTGVSSSSTVTVAALNPDGDNVKEFSVSEAVSISDGVTLTFTPPYYYRWSINSGSSIHKLLYGMNLIDADASTVDSSTDTVDGAITSGVKVVMDNNVSDKMAVGDRITGNVDLNAANVTVVALNPDGDNVKEFSMSEAIALADGLTLTFTTPTTISNYENVLTYTTEVHDEDGSVREVKKSITKASVTALDPLGYKPTITNGLITKQLGNITFSRQVINDLASQACLFYAYGSDSIKSISNATIKLTDLKVELTAPTTTTTAAVRASTTIPVADREGTVQNVSTISGIGIDSSVANPTIASATADGAGNWTASAAQTLESGITLTIGESSRTATITGNIEILNVDDTSFTVYFDVEKFLAAS
jgi:hypothetical protein